MTRPRVQQLLVAGRRMRAATGLFDVFGGPPAATCGARPELSILLVCHGNICRSPMAEDVLRRGLARSGLLGRVVVDSAGMDCAAPGRRPDLRARACARRHGGSIGDLRARRFTVEDFDRFDLILVMDRRNERSTLSLARDPHEREKVRLLGRYSDGKDIADPVHLGAAAFDRAFAQIEVACEGILSRLAPDPATNRLTGPL